MKWFDKLKQLLKIDIRDSFNITIKSNNTSKGVEYNEESKSFFINLEKLSPAQKEEVKQILREAVKEDDKVLLEQKSEELIQDFTLNENSKKAQSLLSYWKGKIPHDDFEALRASLYIRKLFQEGVSHNVIYKLKGDILKKYGPRGVKISNICSSEYFETMLQPLYEEMKKDPDFSNEKFIEKYDIIINEAAFAVFINGSMTVDVVKSVIQAKIQRNLKYGIKFVNIHGIGKRNVIKIREALSYIEDRYHNIDKYIEENEDIIFVKLQFIDYSE